MSKTAKPSLLSYQKSLAPTDAVFKALRGGVEVPVAVKTKGTLGTESQYYDQLGKEKPTGNPQRVDSASLPHDSDTLVVEWSLSVIAGALTPYACDAPAWRRALIGLARSYASAGHFDNLGERYAVNIANGRWAWKNRQYASDFKVVVDAGAGGTFSFDAFAVPLTDFEDALEGPHGDDIRKLGRLIGAAMSGANGMRVLKLKVRGELVLANGAIVYPSQDFENGDDDGDKERVKKILYSVELGAEPRCAAFHEQKIGNALRSIDTWHDGAALDGEEQLEAHVPLPVNPYAQAREEFAVARPRASKRDFYSLLQAGFPDFAKTALEDKHFIMANLVRGGVFGMGKKDKAASSEKEAA